jgi:hypothetical protein
MTRDVPFRAQTDLRFGQSASIMLMPIGLVRPEERGRGGYFHQLYEQ